MSVTLPNDDSPGSVLPVDYDRWRQNFGMSSGSGTATAIPEPTTLVIAVLFAAMTVPMPRLRRR
jgi:hypothetical protein